MSKKNKRRVKYKKASRGYRFVKRTTDIVVSFLGIILLSWLFIILLIVNTFYVKGKPLYFDVRVGKKGRTIKVIKFKTMYSDADDIYKYLTHEQREQWRAERKVDNDPRVLSFGSFLRRTSLDELPQLFNILFGSMTIVGVRPMTQYELDRYYDEEQLALIYGARPGLTGTWQVYGRNEVTFASGERQRLDMLYYENRSLKYDLKIILLTFKAVITERGAQ